MAIYLMAFGAAELRSPDMSKRSVCFVLDLVPDVWVFRRKPRGRLKLRGPGLDCW